MSFDTATILHFFFAFLSFPFLFLLSSPGVLWLSVISEFTYIGLLAMGFLLMCVEVLCLCAKREMNALKINAFAAMCTVLSGEEWGGAS